MARKVRLSLELREHGWMLFREDNRDRHGHFKTHGEAKRVMDCINRGVLPHSEYYRESCRRLLTDEEYEALTPKHEKPMYFNPQKGGIR